MKVRLFCFTLALLTCFLSACQSSLASRDTWEGPKTTEEQKEEKPYEYPKVANPLSWEKIRAIPLANSNMTEAELRKICTDFMRLQLTFEWTPAKSITYNFYTKESDMEFPRGKVYGGLPYMTFNANGNLYIVMDYYDPETGILDPGDVPLKHFASIIGNDCAASPFWAWNRVINSLTNFKDPENKRGFTNIDLTPHHNLIPVGGYRSISEGTWDDGDGTKWVCEVNGKQKIFECYAKLQEADGIVHFFPDAPRSANHLMMCSSTATVVKNEDGTIDGDQSYVTILDQRSNMTPTYTKNGVVLYEGGIDAVFTFNQLYQEYYIPFTFKEFLGTDPVEKGEAKLVVDGDMYDYETLREGKIISNYGISHVRITYFDKEGNEKYSYRAIPTLLNTRDFDLENLLLPASKWHATEENTCVITAFIGTGEEFELLRGTVLPQNS